MIFLFYIIGWLTILFGLGSGGYAVYNGVNAYMSAAAAPISSDFGAFLKWTMEFGVYLAVPGLWVIFWGLLLLAVGAALSRLDEIAYNTRSMT